MTTAANTPDPARLPDAPEGIPLRRQVILFFREFPPTLRHFWDTQREWLWILVPLALLLIRSMRWGYGSWISDDYLLAYQLLVPFAAAWIIWIRRPYLNILVQELEALFPGDSRKKRGNPWLLIVGCVLMLLSAISLWIPLAFLALGIIVAGCIYYLYGPFILRALWQPLLFLIFAVPIPNGVLGALDGRLQVGTALISTQLLKLMLPTTVQQSVLITLPHYALLILPPLNGLGIALPALAATVWFNIYRNIRMDLGTLLAGGAIILSIPIAILRVLAVALLGNANFTLGETFRTGIGLHLTTFLLTLLVIYLVQLLTRALPRLMARRLSEFEQDLREAQRSAASASDGEGR